MMSPEIFRCKSGVYVLGTASKGAAAENNVTISKMLDDKGATCVASVTDLGCTYSVGFLCFTYPSKMSTYVFRWPPMGAGHAFRCKGDTQIATSTFCIRIARQLAGELCSKPHFDAAGGASRCS